MSTVCLTLLALLIPRAHAIKAPTFECTDAKKGSYLIWLGTDRNILRVGERAIALSGPNFGRTVATGDPIVYNGWRGTGKDVFSQLDFSTEVTTQHLVEQGSTRIRLSVVVDDKEPDGLRCHTTSNATPVVAAAAESKAERRYADAIARVAGERTPDGVLTAIGVMQVEAAVRRMALIAGKSTELRTAFTEAAAAPLKSIASRSIAQIGKRLRPPARDFWDEVLAGAKYANYPEVARYTGWINDGLLRQPHRDLGSVVAGFTEFAKSKGFHDKDIHAFFVKEVQASLKVLGEEEAMQTKNSLEGNAAALFFQLWVKATGRRTVADYPAIDRIAREIAAAASSKEFDPMRVQKSLAEFAHSAMAKDNEARAMFFQTAAPILSGLTPRQREDLMGWLEGPERALYLELSP